MEHVNELKTLLVKLDQRTQELGEAQRIQELLLIRILGEQDKVLHELNRREYEKLMAVLRDHIKDVYVYAEEKDVSSQVLVASNQTVIEAATNLLGWLAGELKVSSPGDPTRVQYLAASVFAKVIRCETQLANMRRDNQALRNSTLRELQGQLQAEAAAIIKDATVYELACTRAKDLAQIAALLFGLQRQEWFQSGTMLLLEPNDRSLLSWEDGMDDLRALRELEDDGPDVEIIQINNLKRHKWYCELQNLDEEAAHTPSDVRLDTLLHGLGFPKTEYAHVHKVPKAAETLMEYVRPSQRFAIMQMYKREFKCDVGEIVPLKPSNLLDGTGTSSGEEIPSDSGNVRSDGSSQPPVPPKPSDILDIRDIKYARRLSIAVLICSLIFIFVGWSGIFMSPPGYIAAILGISASTYFIRNVRAGLKREHERRLYCSAVLFIIASTISPFSIVSQAFAFLFWDPIAETDEDGLTRQLISNPLLVLLNILSIISLLLISVLSGFAAGRIKEHIQALHERKIKVTGLCSSCMCCRSCCICPGCCLQPIASSNVDPADSTSTVRA